MGLFHRGKKNNDDEPDSVQTNSFSDIMNGLQYAVNCAQDTLQNHQIQNLTRLFEGTNANNANTFQSKKIMVGDKTIDIPLIALISHHYLAMDNVQISSRRRSEAWNHRFRKTTCCYPVRTEPISRCR